MQIKAGRLFASVPTWVEKMPRWQPVGLTRPLVGWIWAGCWISSRRCSPERIWCDMRDIDARVVVRAARTSPTSHGGPSSEELLFAKSPQARQMITLPVDAGVPPSIAVEVEGNDLKLSPHWEVRGVGYALGAACGHSTSPH